VVAALALCLATAAAGLSACSSDEGSTDPGGGASGPGPTSGPGGGGGSDGGLCLLNNCTSDEHCQGCPDGRKTCLENENRCVACDPNTKQGCPPGQECSSYGLCVPAGTTCPTDDKGNPTVKCQKNSDCAACSPMHQVCAVDAAGVGKCQACTPTNTQHCLASDICVDGKCSPKCPQTCAKDNDCAQCGAPGKEAHACFQHKCAQCSPTYPCAAGLQCVNGVCIPPCGLPGPVAGTCGSKDDCKYCGVADPTKPGNWDCKTPVNDPSHGFCAPPAGGCSDLGGAAALPAPYGQYTQTCSKDADCAGVSIDFNVGKLVRDLVGDDEVFGVKINDALVKYGMPICAEVKITETITCGLCVPCEVDADCKPIQLKPVVAQMFKNDPLAFIAFAVLIDILYGKQSEQEQAAINFFCQPVAAGYGACIPCADPTKPCGKGGGSGTGSCDHGVCEEGVALNGSCSPCAGKVCAADAFCCDGTNGKWDALCVKEANDLCGGTCEGGNTCLHDPCSEGAALDGSCNDCVADVCADDAFCCNQQGGKWDNLCVSAAKNTSKYPSCAGACGGGCVHSECSTGAKLDKTCSPCATKVCDKDPFCCSTDWDSMCVTGAKNEPACGC
jgi:hypothetical protein